MAINGNLELFGITDKKYLVFLLKNNQLNCIQYRWFRVIIRGHIKKEENGEQAENEIEVSKG